MNTLDGSCRSSHSYHCQLEAQIQQEQQWFKRATYRIAKRHLLRSGHNLIVIIFRFLLHCIGFQYDSADLSRIMHTRLDDGCSVTTLSLLQSINELIDTCELCQDHHHVVFLDYCQPLNSNTDQGMCTFDVAAP